MPDRLACQKLRVAVVGGGVSGLVAARALGRSHDVTLYEQDSHVGGHVATITVPNEHGTQDVDTGFIVFNRRNYPLFSALLDELGVATQPTDMSFGVRCDQSGIEYAGRSAKTLFAQPANLANPGHWRMLADIRRFFDEGTRLAEASPDLTVDGYVQSRKLSPEFADRFLKPIGAALWSSPTTVVGDYPICFVASFLRAHGMMQFADRPQWEVVCGGSKRYLEALVPTLEATVRLSDPVRAVQRVEKGVQVVSALGSATYDELVFACHADQALDVLTHPTQEECEALSALPYQANDVVLHTDESVLPRSKTAWASWNYHVGKELGGGAAVTYNMNLLQSIDSSVTYCVSLNEPEIDPAKVLGRFTYHHPVATTAGLEVRKNRSAMLRHHGISYCGAYWGFGFHEDGVRSAHEVAGAFGVSP